MDLTRRKAVLGFGAAVLTPLLAPGEATACLFGHRRHRRAGCSQPGVPTPSHKVPCLDFYKESVGFITCVQTSPFIFGTPCQFTLWPATGCSFNQNGSANLVSISEANFCVSWQQTALTSDPLVHNRLDFVSTPMRQNGPGCGTTVGSSGLTISVQSVYNANCWGNYLYTPDGGITYRV